MPVVYIDVVWLVNFVMDAVLLATTGWILKRPVRLRRVLVGAAIGAVYALLLFVPALSTLTTWPGKALVSLLMVASSIRVRNWLDFARAAAVFYFVSFVFAGAAIALHFAIPGVSLGKTAVVAGNRLAFTTSLKSLSLLVAIPLSVAVIRFAIGRARAFRVQAVNLYSVRALVMGESLQFVGLMDTGNQLRDPVTRRPVCLVDAAVMAGALPESLRTAVLRGEDPVLALHRVDDPDWVGRFSIVPLRGAGGSGQVTVAIRPDELSLVHEGTQTNVGNRCLLAIHPGRLSGDDRFQAILHTELIAGDEGFEKTTSVEQVEPKVENSFATGLGEDSSQTRG